MPLEDKITKYSVSVFQNNFLTYFRQIRLSLESGGNASLQFPKDRPTDWLQVSGSTTSIYMTEDQYSEVYHLLQSENPVFLTAGNFFGLQVGAVHSELDLSLGETPGEGDQDPQSLEALIRRARKQKSKA